MWIYGSIVFLSCLTVQGEEECEPGQYGDGCSKSCSQNCKPFPNGIVKCHKETGECFEGCEAGVYGDQCDEPCSKHCLGNICNMHNGHCSLGCIGNHIGVFCEIYNGITIVHQGTTTVTTGVVPTSSSQVVIPVVGTVLVLIFIFIHVGAVVIFIWRRKKKKKKKKKEETPVSETQIESGRRETLRGSNQDDSASSEGIALIPGSSQKSDVHATSGEGDTPMSGTPSRPDSRATPTHARRDAREDTDLHDACREGKLAVVKRILDTGRADVNCRSRGGRTPVMAAALMGYRDVVELLVSRGADVSLVDGVGDNILHWACEGGYRKTVESVLSLDGVDINSRGEKSWTPVMVAAGWGHRDVVEFLVSRGADVSLVSDDCNNILHYACLGGDRETVEFVLSLDGVDINVRNNHGKTAADVARGCGHRQLSDLLVSRGTQ